MLKNFVELPAAGVAIVIAATAVSSAVVIAAVMIAAATTIAIAPAATAVVIGVPRLGLGGHSQHQQNGGTGEKDCLSQHDRSPSLNWRASRREPDVVSVFPRRAHAATLAEK